MLSLMSVFLLERPGFLGMERVGLEREYPGIERVGIERELGIERDPRFFSVVVVSFASSQIHVISGLIFGSQNFRSGDSKGFKSF